MSTYRFKLVLGSEPSEKVHFDFIIEAENYLDSITQFCSKFFKVYEIQNKIKNQGGGSNVYSIYKTKTYSLSMFTEGIAIFSEIKFNISKLGINPIIELQKFILNYIDNTSNDLIEDVLKHK